MKDIPILYENDEIIVIDKPAGVSVQGGEGIRHPMDEELSKQLGYRIHLVHRLDKETSGLMIVAKSAKAAAKWTSVIAGKAARKEYEAVCFGIPVVGGKPARKGTIRADVIKDGRKLSAETSFSVVAEKEFEIASKDKDGNERTDTIILTKIRLTLGTGRMHQIRIHLASSSAPIAGDDKHGDFKKNKLARKIGIKSLQLRAFRLTIPTENGNRTFEIPGDDIFTSEVGQNV